MMTGATSTGRSLVCPGWVIAKQHAFWQPLDICHVPHRRSHPLAGVRGDPAGDCIGSSIGGNTTGNLGTMGPLVAKVWSTPDSCESPTKCGAPKDASWTSCWVWLDWAKLKLTLSCSMALGHHWHHAVLWLPCEEDMCLHDLQHQPERAENSQMMPAAIASLDLAVSQ